MKLSEVLVVVIWIPASFLAVVYLFFVMLFFINPIGAAVTLNFVAKLLGA